jgi:putative chitinase
MIQLTSKHLQSLGIDEKWLIPLNETFTKYDINSLKQQAAFIGQAQHESNNFKNLEEGLNYSASRLMAVWPSRFSSLDVANKYANNPEKLANKVYGGRADLGNTEDGDGFKFHGRGIFQITGRSNYKVCSDAIRQPLLDHPELLLEPKNACMSAGWFWNKKGLNALCELEDWSTITKRINGGVLGLNDRINRIHKAMDILGT